MAPDLPRMPGLPAAGAGSRAQRLRMQAIQEAELCDVCRYYAWHGSMWPQRGADGRRHHPSCRAVVGAPDVVSGAPGWVVTPQTMLDYMREVDGLYVSLNTAVHLQLGAPLAPMGPAGPAGTMPAVPPVLFANWLRKFTEWKRFFAEHEAFWDRMTGAVADTTERYEKDAMAYRDQFKAAGVNLSGVVYVEDRAPGGPSLSLPGMGDVKDSLMWAAIGLGAILLLTRR